MTNEYLAALDDSGQRHIRPSTVPRSFFFGGVVMPSKSLSSFHRFWDSISADFDEIKRANFLRNISLPDGNEIALREAILSVLMEEWRALPFFLAFDKSETGPGFTETTRKGGVKIALREGVPFAVASLNVHMRFMGGRISSVYVDQLGSEKENLDIQNEWTEQCQLIADSRLIPKGLSFVDSKEVALVQLADVLMGVFRDAQEEQRGMAPGLSRLLRKAQAKQLWGFHPS